MAKSISQSIAHPELASLFLHVADLWHMQDNTPFNRYHKPCFTFKISRVVAVFNCWCNLTDCFFQKFWDTASHRAKNSIGKIRGYRKQRNTAWPPVFRLHFGGMSYCSYFTWCGNVFMGELFQIDATSFLLIYCLATVIVLITTIMQSPHTFSFSLGKG